MTSHINCYYISIQIVKEKELQYTLKCYSEKRNEVSIHPLSCRTYMVVM